MNAQQQYEKYHGEMREMAENMGMGNPYQYINERRWDFALRLLSDLKLKLQYYGEQAYPLSEKQIAMIEQAIAEQREYVIRASKPVETTEQFIARNKGQKNPFVTQKTIRPECKLVAFLRNIDWTTGRSKS